LKKASGPWKLHCGLKQLTYEVETLNQQLKKTEFDLNQQLNYIQLENKQLKLELNKYEKQWSLSSYLRVFFFLVFLLLVLPLGVKRPRNPMSS